MCNRQLCGVALRLSRPVLMVPKRQGLHPPLRGELAAHWAGRPPYRSRAVWDSQNVRSFRLSRNFAALELHTAPAGRFWTKPMLHGTTANAMDKRSANWYVSLTTADYYPGREWL